MSDDEDDKQEYSVSYAQLEQLGPSQRSGIEGIAMAINNGEGMAAAIRKAGQLRIDPIDRFKILCSIYYDKLGGDRTFIIKWDTIILKINDKLRWTMYRNPIAFIVGARMIGPNRKINKQSFGLIYDQLKSTLTTENISPEDIIRYARMWENLLKNDIK